MRLKTRNKVAVCKSTVENGVCMGSIPTKSTSLSSLVMFSRLSNHSLTLLYFPNFTFWAKNVGCQLQLEKLGLYVVDP